MINYGVFLRLQWESSVGTVSRAHRRRNLHLRIRGLDAYGNRSARKHIDEAMWHYSPANDQGQTLLDGRLYSITDMQQTTGFSYNLSTNRPIQRSRMAASRAAPTMPSASR